MNQFGLVLQQGQPPALGFDNANPLFGRIIDPSTSGTTTARLSINPDGTITYINAYSTPPTRWLAVGSPQSSPLYEIRARLQMRAISPPCTFDMLGYAPADGSFTPWMDVLTPRAITVTRTPGFSVAMVAGFLEFRYKGTFNALMTRSFQVDTRIDSGGVFVPF